MKRQAYKRNLWSNGMCVCGHEIGILWKMEWEPMKLHQQYKDGLIEDLELDEKKNSSSRALSMVSTTNFKYA